eukprot:Opistho-2@69397
MAGIEFRPMLALAAVTDRDGGSSARAVAGTGASPAPPPTAMTPPAAATATASVSPAAPGMPAGGTMASCKKEGGRCVGWSPHFVDSTRTNSNCARHGRVAADDLVCKEGLWGQHHSTASHVLCVD